METANPTGADTSSLSAAASRISAITEPKKPAPKEVKETPKEAQEVITPEAELETQAPEQTEETEQESSDEGTTEAQETSEETSFNSLQELADALGMPMEQFLKQVKGKAKVAGQEREVTLEEALNGYQMESDYRQKTMELSNQRKAFEAERDKIANDYKARLGEASQLSQFLENQLFADYNAVNWQELRQVNPAEYAALQQDFNQRHAQLQQAKQQVTLEQQRVQQEEQSKQSEAMNKYLADEKAKLAAVIPEFSDPVKAKAAASEMRTFLKANGFQDEEINQVHDHRHVLLIRDAMKYRGLQDKKPEVTNKVKLAPKLTKPGVKATPTQTNLQGLRARLKKSGSERDAAAIIAQLNK